MSDDANLIGPEETAFRVELTAAQLKVTWSALKSFMNDFGHEEKDIHMVIREVLAKLPEEDSIATIDLGAELARRRASGAA
jgi:hypothetical protein